MIKIKILFFVLVYCSCFLTSATINSQNINRFDENNKRTGIWKKYYPNKRIRYVGQFEKGKEIGVFKFYHITSSDHPISIKKFLKNSDSVFVQFFTTTGRIESEGYLKARKRVGNWKYFYPNGTIMSEENYEKGKLDGEQLIYYPDGKVTESTNYKNGFKEGVNSKFSNKGILIEEITYKQGMPNGLAKYFELNGNLKETGFYKNGKREGVWEYYMDGEVATEDQLKKSKKSTYIKKKG
jgi:antitoxin component YwqK of YwqJK toxin-antitoxin module